MNNCWLQLVRAYPVLGKVKQCSYTCIPVSVSPAGTEVGSAGEDAGLCAWLVLAVFGLGFFVVAVVLAGIIMSVLNF